MRTGTQPKDVVSDLRQAFKFIGIENDGGTTKVLVLKPHPCPQQASKRSRLGPAKTAFDILDRLLGRHPAALRQLAKLAQGVRLGHWLLNRKP